MRRPATVQHSRTASSPVGSTSSVGLAMTSGSPLLPAQVRAVALLLAGVAFFGGCTDDVTTVQPTPSRKVGVVVNSVDLSLTVFSVDSPAVATTIGLGPAGSPVGLSLRNHLAAVPLGLVPAVAVVDLREARVLHTVALPPGSGATGSAFLNDSVALVANPSRNSVTPVNVLRGTAGIEVPVGAFPQGVVVADRDVLVLNGELGPDFLPARSSSVSILDPETMVTSATVQLSGENAAAGVVVADGTVLVMNQGRFMGDNGTLSLVDARAREEEEHFPGFGDFPGALALGPDGRVYVSSFAYGVVVWDLGTRTFVRGPGDAVTPGGVPSVSGLAFDDSGRLYTLEPDCTRPSVAHRLDGNLDVEATIPVGTCPMAIGFTAFDP